MVTVTLAVAAVIGATIAIFVDRGIQARKKAAQAETVQEQSQKGHLLQPVFNLRNRLIGKNHEQAKKFQAWVDAHIDDIELKAWLTGLSPQAASALSEQLADFCVNLGFELNWLLDDNLSQDPEIEQEALAVVTAYCRACWHAAQSYTDFELFKLLQDMKQAPFARKHRDLGRNLFGELVKREMAASVPPELFLASEKERQEHMTRAIQQAAEANRDRFKAVLKDVLLMQKAHTDQQADKQAEGEPAKKRQLFSFGKGSKEQEQGQAAPTTINTAAESAPGSATAGPSSS
jgi:hypothetical protein